MHKFKMKKLLTLLTLLILISCVTRKGIDFCGTESISSRKKDWIDSKILKLGTNSNLNAETKIYGNVYGVSKWKRMYSIDTLYGASIILKTFADSLICGVSVGKDGQYNMTVHQGKYYLLFQMIGYNKLIIENFEIKPGEQKELSVILGQGLGQTKYSMTDSINYIKSTGDKDK
jgi:hypothetical protein